jgi:hypothetical protein
MEKTMSESLVVVNNTAPLAKVAAQQSALERLFRLKPAQLELVSKSTQQEGAVPGTFRVISTNEKFDTMRAVILFEPVEQRALYTKGVYSKDAKECFSLDNFQPHGKAKDPKALFCSECEYGDKGWEKWRAAKASGVTGAQLSELVPQCKKYWHLFIIDRQTKMPYYFNIKGTSVSYFEEAMQNIARLMKLIEGNIKLHNQQNPNDQKPLPTSVADIIWQISFTMYTHQPVKGGQWALGMKDFQVMTRPEDAKEFGTILQDYVSRRNQGKIVSQAEVEAEGEAQQEYVAASPQATKEQEVAAKNAQIQI